MNVEEFSQLRKLFHQEEKLSKAIEEWENGKITGAEVNQKFGLTDKNMLHYARTFPKGMTIEKISPNNPLFTDCIEIGHAEQNPNIKLEVLYEDEEMIIFVNKRSPLKSQHGKGASMSYIHFLACPKKRKYNCISLTKEDIPMLENMAKKIDEIYQGNYREIFANLVARALLSGNVKSVEDFELDPPDYVDTEKFNNFFEKILEIHQTFEEFAPEEKKKDQTFLANYLLARLNFNKIELLKYDKKYFHVHPHHSIGHLHFQCFVELIKSKNWESLIREMISLENLISSLENTF